MAIRLLLVDDHRLLREGLRRLLESCGDIEVAAEAESAGQALRLARVALPDMIVTDLALPGLSGIALVRVFKSTFPSLPLLVLSMHTEEGYALRSLRAGANGYLLKDCVAEELLGGVREVAAGGVYLSRSLAERVDLDLAASRAAQAVRR